MQAAEAAAQAKQQELEAEAQTKLAEMHYRGEVGPINFAEARRLLASAVLQGQADAQVLLGEMHFRGEGGEVDMGKARRLLVLDPIVYIARMCMFVGACVFFAVIYIKAREPRQEQRREVAAGNWAAEAASAQRGRSFSVCRRGPAATECPRPTQA